MAESANLSAQKKELRQRILALREQLSPVVRATQSAAITGRLLQSSDYQQATTVLGYMSFGAEFDSTAWVRQVLADGKRLLLPKVNQPTSQLDLYWVHNPATQLASGAWGILEPAPERCEQLGELNKVEFVLLPGVAFTRQGARLGYGGGFYDKLLARMAHRPPLVAAAFGLQLVEHLPQEATDVKVDWIVTEQETIACGQP